MKRLLLGVLLLICPAALALDQATRCMAHTLVEIAYKMACNGDCLDELNPMVMRAYEMLDKGIEVDDMMLEEILKEFAQGPMYRKSCCCQQSAVTLITLQNSITALSAQLTAAQAAIITAITTQCP